MLQKKYQAVLLDEQLPDGRSTGEVHLDHNQLVFNGENKKLIFSLNQLEISKGGTGNHQLFFKPKGEKFTIYVLEKSILKEEFFKRNDNNSTFVTNFKIKRAGLTVGIIFLGLIILSPFIGLIVFRNELTTFIAKQVPQQYEATLGKQYIKQISITENIDSISPAAQILREKAKLVTNQIDGEQEFHVYISDSEEINAYALPGGFVVFNKGLLKKAKNWEEVLGVMGHEMAHVTQKHHARGMLSKIGWGTLLTFIIGDGSVLTDFILGSAINLESLSYSRDFETEADEKGLEYIQKAKIKPNGLINFFSTLKQESGLSSNIPELLSTHPDPDNRAENLAKKIGDTTNLHYIDIGDYQAYIKHF